MERVDSDNKCITPIEVKLTIKDRSEQPHQSSKNRQTPSFRKSTWKTLVNSLCEQKKKKEAKERARSQL